MKRKRKYSTNERRAYWIGVGLSASRTEYHKLLDSTNPKIKKSIRSGFTDDSVRDISKKFM